MIADSSLRMRFLLFLTIFVSTASLGGEPDLRQIFLDMPDKHLTVISQETGKPFVFSKKERAKLVKLIDQKNGYMEIEGKEDTNFAGAQIALFKTSSGGYLIGWHVDNNGDNTTHIQIFSVVDSGWRDVTKDVIPKITYDMVDRRAKFKIPSFKKSRLSDCASGTYAYKLPRYGTTIQIVTKSDCVPAGKDYLLWELKFNGVKFELSK